MTRTAAPQIVWCFMVLLLKSLLKICRLSSCLCFSHIYSRNIHVYDDIKIETSLSFSSVVKNMSTDVSENSCTFSFIQVGTNGKSGDPVPLRRPVVAGSKFVRDHAPMGAYLGLTDIAWALQTRVRLVRG